jgi:hypothetical protein
MIIPKLQNGRAFVLKRCSSNSQVGTSLDLQDAALAQVLADNKVVVVGERELAGVTGSVPGARDDIVEIIRLKREGLDFRFLILPNTDRFSRTGSLHGNSILWDLEGEGITVYFVAENLWSDDRYHQMLLSMLFDAARQTAVAISRGSTAGNTKSFLEGRSPHAKAPPYGMDRMYSVDGKDMFIIRNLADGTQQMRDPYTGDVTRTFGRNPKKGTPAHYKKQKNEQIRLVAGDPLHVAVVGRICEEVHVRGRSCCSVAKELTDAGIPSPSGVDWPSMSVRFIAYNPAYVGLLARGQTTQAVYHTASPGAPIEAKLEPNELRKRSRPLRRERPYEQWILREDPALAEFLPAHLREPTRRAIEADLQRRASSKKRSRDRHKQSAFILKDVLRSRQGGHRMTGRIGGRRNQVRYYQVTRARNNPRTDNPLKGFVAAEPLERAILGVLREVLVNRSDLRDAVKRALDRLSADQDGGKNDRTSMERELNRRQRQIASALDSLIGDEAADQPIQDRINRYRSEAARLSAALRAVPVAAPIMDIDSVADRVANDLADLSKNFLGDDLETLRQIVGLLVGRMEADLTTKEIEIDLRIPNWLAASLTRQPTLGLDAMLTCKPFNETQQSEGSEIAAYRCQQTAKRPVCFDCRRVRRAA